MIGPVLIIAAAAAISAVVTYALLPMLRRHALAHPNARSSHKQPTPQGGGIAVIAATVAVSVSIAAFWLRDPVFNPSLGLLLLAVVFVSCVGAVDDVCTIGVAPRLLLQGLTMLVVIASLPEELRIVPQLPWWIERALLLLAGMWFVNLTNFMDGIDLMTVVEFVPLTIGVAIVAMLGNLPAYSIAIALALCGALLGFAPFNRPVARIFLGDVGSLPIGLLSTWLLILIAGAGHLAAALILPLYYLADATLTLARRVANREPFWQAHRTHFYQRATDRGFTVLGIVGRVFAVNAALVALAVATVVWPDPLNAAMALATAAALVGWLLYAFARGKP